MRSALISTGAALAALLASAAPAGAATIVLNNLGGVDPGSKAYQGFTTAANFWAKQIANPITINLDVGFGHLGPNILGQTQSSSTFVTTASYENVLASEATSALDHTAAGHLPAVSGGAISMVTPGYNSIDSGSGDGLGVDTTKLVFDNDATNNNRFVNANTATLKALGVTGLSGPDGSVVFSSDFKFDFDPQNGIAPGYLDFTGVAIHEIGHALGFTSGVDLYDLIGGPNGLFATGHPEVCGVNCEDYDSEADAFGTPLDLFRYSSDPLGMGPTLTWAPGVESYFSVDGGATPLFGFSTGQFNGDGWQASHWKAPTASPFCSGLIGIMNPYLCDGTEGIVTNADFDALDAIGYNFVFGDNVPTSLTTDEISRKFAIAPVPEPGEWALLIAGFGAMGAVVRRRRRMPAAV